MPLESAGPSLASWANAALSVPAVSAAATSSRGSVLPTTKGWLNVSSAKNTTSEFVACFTACASESSSA